MKYFSLFRASGSLQVTNVSGTETYAFYRVSALSVLLSLSYNLYGTPKSMMLF